MAKSQQSFNKSEKEKKRIAKRKAKAEKAAERKANKSSDTSLDAMMAYVDENGNIVDTPPDPSKRKEVKVEDMVIGATKREKDEAVDPIKRGRVDFFNDSKGFGFIKELETQEKYFVHINGCQDEIAEMDLVQFELEQGMKGLICVRVKKITEAQLKAIEDKKKEALAAKKAEKEAAEKAKAEEAAAKKAEEDKTK